MALSTDKLYLVSVKYHTVAIIPAKDPLEAINKYITKTGFDAICAYFCSYLMTNTKIGIRNFFNERHHFIKTNTKTMGGDFISVSSCEVTSCDDIFSLTNANDTNNPLFVRPTIEEVRNCIGFSKEPMYRLRKFCM